MPFPIMPSADASRDGEDVLPDQETLELAVKTLRRDQRQAIAAAGEG